jgi:hypothetical protein
MKILDPDFVVGWFVTGLGAVTLLSLFLATICYFCSIGPWNPERIKAAADAKVILEREREYGK